MRLTRIHVDAPLAPGLRLPLPESSAGHLSRVLRLNVGDACIVFNGDGNDYHARISHVGKREVLVDIGHAQALDNESPLRLVLIQAVARGEKMDWILQKATELGVAAIVPVDSERSEVKLTGNRAERRLAHWRGVVSSACEQCGRARVPDIHLPRTLATALDDLADSGLRLSLDPDGSRTVAELVVDTSQPIMLAVGPEGGWSQRDLQMLAAAGFDGLRLGPRTLRTETAGLAVLAVLQGRLGDLA